MITVMEAHEEVLMHCDKQVLAYAFYDLFCQAWYSEDEYFRAARYTNRVIPGLLQSEADEDITLLLYKGKTSLHCARICVMVGQFEHAMQKYEDTQEVWDHIFKKDPSLEANFKWKQAQILTNQAEVMLTKSMVTYGKVTRQARQEYIST